MRKHHSIKYRCHIFYDGCLLHLRTCRAASLLQSAACCRCRANSCLQSAGKVTHTQILWSHTRPRAIGEFTRWHSAGCSAVSTPCSALQPQCHCSGCMPHRHDVYCTAVTTYCRCPIVAGHVFKRAAAAASHCHLTLPCINAEYSAGQPGSTHIIL